MGSFHDEESSTCHPLAMLDLALFRPESGGDPELVRESQRRRGADVAVVDRIVASDAVWRAAQRDLGQQRAALAAAKKAVARSRGHRPDTSTSDAPVMELSEAISAAAALAAQAAEAERTEHDAQEALQALLLTVGNLVHEHAPYGDGAVWRGTGGEHAADSPAVRRLLAEGWAERVSGQPGWRACGPGLLVAQAVLTHALGSFARRGCAPGQLGRAL